jgi:hypothetical protein
MTAYRYVAAQAPLVCARARDPSHGAPCYDRSVRDPTGLAIAAVAVSACIARDQLVCEDDSQCTRFAEGVCHDGGCAYPDGDCPSGLRYGDFAGERSGRCVDESVADDTSSTGIDPTTEGGVSETLGETSSGPPGSSSGTDDDTGSIPSVCDDVACSGAGTCVVIDDAPSCACESGYYMVGLECLLDPCEHVACHYVDATLGDDANEGTLDAPWRTVSRVGQAFGDAVPGDHFLFRRGGEFGDPETGTRLYVTAATGSAEAPIVIGAYGPIDDGRPRIAPGNVRILSSSHVVLRDLELQDDSAIDPGSRPCVLVQESDHVVVHDTLLYDCVTHGVWVSYGSSYTSIVDNVVHDVGSDGISVSDITYVDPDVHVGHHHWVIDNLVEHSDAVGIRVEIGSPELALGDSKVVGNTVADSELDSIRSTTTGFAWVVDNVTARAAAPEIWQASLVMGAQAGGQLSGNIAFETGGNGILVNRIARLEANTVIHDGDVGEALFVDDQAQLTASRNLLWPRGGGDTLWVIEGTANDHIVALDDSWYGGVDDSACSFRDPTGVYDLAGWQEATGLDVDSTCGPIPGLGAFVIGLPPSSWDEELWDALAPDSSWADCASPAGARDCEGMPIGPAIEPLSGFDDSGGLGWSGPLIVRQRYDVVQ